MTLLYDVDKDHLVKFKAIFEGGENRYIWKCGPFGIASSASLANVTAQVIYKHGPINGLVLPVTQSPDADFELFLVTIDPGREPFSVEFTGIFHDKLPQRAFDTYSFGVDLSQEQYNKQKLDLFQVALDGVFEASVVSSDQYTIDAASTSGSIIEFKNARGNFTVNLKDLSATNRQGLLLLLAAGIFGTALSLLAEFFKDILR